MDCLGTVAKVDRVCNNEHTIPSFCQDHRFQAAEVRQMEQVWETHLSL